MNSIEACALSFVLTLGPATALACGVCIEDKMAATYDHAVVTRAMEHRHVVVFCEIRGEMQAARLRKAASRVAGIDIATVRTSAEPAALSFVVDPRKQSPEAAVARLQRALDAKTKITLLRTLPAADH